MVKALGFSYIDTHTSPNAPVTIDLSGLAKANSVTVAVLMAWYRHAKSLGLDISFAHLSPSLCNIINFSGLHEVLTPELNQAKQGE